MTKFRHRETYEWRVWMSYLNSPDTPSSLFPYIRGKAVDAMKRLARAQMEGR